VLIAMIIIISYSIDRDQITAVDEVQLVQY